MKAKLPTVILFVASILLGQTAWANMISGGVDPSTGLPEEPVFINPIDSGPNWEIGPIEIIPCSTCPPWTKYLGLPPGTNQSPINTTYMLWEHIIVGGTENWIDWHEDILTPGWEWTAGDIFFEGTMAASIPGLIVSAEQPFSGDPDSPSTSIWFDFDPLVPGTAITIEKTIRCNGIGGAVCTGGNIAVAEYPSISSVPEPATLALMGLGLAGIGYQRQRRKKAACRQHYTSTAGSLGIPVTIE